MTWPFTDLNHVLTTTRSVRLRLDYDRPVPIGLIGECLQLAVQAPTGGGAEDWRWLVVGDPTLKAELATLYHAAYQEYVHQPLHSAAGADSDLVRGLGTVITTLHLHHAASVAALLGIPDDAVQITMLPVAYTVGTDFKVAARRPVDAVSYLDRWGTPLPYRDKPVDRLTGEDHG